LINVVTVKSRKEGLSPCDFMHYLDIAELYKPGTVLLLPIMWVYLHSLLHSEPQKKVIHGKAVRYVRSRSFKVIEICS